MPVSRAPIIALFLLAAFGSSAARAQVAALFRPDVMFEADAVAVISQA